MRASIGMVNAADKGFEYAAANLAIFVLRDERIARLPEAARGWVAAFSVNRLFGHPLPPVPVVDGLTEENLRASAALASIQLRSAQGCRVAATNGAYCLGYARYTRAGGRAKLFHPYIGFARALAKNDTYSAGSLARKVEKECNLTLSEPWGRMPGGEITRPLWGVKEAMLLDGLDQTGDPVRCCQVIVEAVKSLRLQEPSAAGQ